MSSQLQPIPDHDKNKRGELSILGCLLNHLQEQTSLSNRPVEHIV